MKIGTYGQCIESGFSERLQRDAYYPRPVGRRREFRIFQMGLYFPIRAEMRNLDIQAIQAQRR